MFRNCLACSIRLKYDSYIFAIISGITGPLLIANYAVNCWLPFSRDCLSFYVPYILGPYWSNDGYPSQCAEGYDPPFDNSYPLSWGPTPSIKTLIPQRYTTFSGHQRDLVLWFPVFRHVRRASVVRSKHKNLNMDPIYQQSDTGRQSWKEKIEYENEMIWQVMNLNLVAKKTVDLPLIDLICG